MSNHSYEKELENVVKDNAQKYYETGKQQISDEEFDALIEEIKNRTPDSKVLTTGWGYKVNDKTKIKHKYAHVGSLNKVRTVEEVNNFFSSTPLDKYKNLDISIKLDGISAVLYYKNGFLVKALTRGDGEYGQDITTKMEIILRNTKSDRKVYFYDTPFTGAVRGEITMPVYEFGTYQKEHPEAKNSRNSVAGLINGLDITSDYKYLRFVVYSLVGYEQPTYGEKLDRIDLEDVHSDLFYYNSHFMICPREFLNTNVVTQFNEEELNKILNEFAEKWKKKYFIDGVVITEPMLIVKGNAAVEQNSCAFKFQEEVKVATVDHIEWNMSKSGNFIPVVILENPVELADTMVSRVTAYNANYIYLNQLGKGSIITIKKSGEIIPSIISVITKTGPDLIDACPYCGSILHWDENHIHLCCSESTCPRKNEKLIEIICTNLAPIDGLGWKTIQKCFNELGYEPYSMENLLNAPRFKSAKENSEHGMFNRMLDKLDNGKFTLSAFLLSLNIPGLGKIGAERWQNSRLAKDYCDALCDEYMIRHQPSRTQIYFRGLEIILQDRTVVSLLEHEYNSYFVAQYKLLKDRIMFTEEDSEKRVENVKGYVVITGKLVTAKRDDFEKQLKEKGWVLQKTVVKSTNYLITNTTSTNTAKNQKADELGIKKVTEAEFINNIM